MTISIERRPVGGDGGVRDGALISRDDILFAVFSRLTEDDVHDGGPTAGMWFLEAGLGPFSLLEQIKAPSFETLDDAAAWVDREVARRWAAEPAGAARGSSGATD